MFHCRLLKHVELIMKIIKISFNIWFFIFFQSSLHLKSFVFINIVEIIEQNQGIYKKWYRKNKSLVFDLFISDIFFFLVKKE